MQGGISSQENFTLASNTKNIDWNFHTLIGLLRWLIFVLQEFASPVVVDPQHPPPWSTIFPSKKRWSLDVFVVLVGNELSILTTIYFQNETPQYFIDVLKDFC